MGYSCVQCCWLQILLVLSMKGIQHSTGELNGEQLVMTSVIYRHGDRSAIRTYPNDPHGEKWWTEERKVPGLGQLSPKGVLQEYKLGQFLRDRYKGFLSERFYLNEIYVRSTDYERTLMSAQAVLAGLYKPGPVDDPNWNQDIHWRPTPVHTVPQKDDMLLLGHHAENCPKLNEAQPDMLKVYEDYAKDRKDLLDILAVFRNHTGANISSIGDLQGVRDTLLCESLHGVPTPSWVPVNFSTTMEKELGPLSYYLAFHGPEKSRRSIGYFLQKVITDMQTRMSFGNDSTCCKMYMYSAHDTTVGSVLNGLQVYPNCTIPYSTAVMIELIKRPVTGNPYVKIILHRYANSTAPNDTSAVPIISTLTLPGCAPECPLQKFIELTKDYVTDDPYSECNVRPVDAVAQLTKVIIISVVTGTVVLILVMTLQIFCHRKYCHKKSKRQTGFRKIRVDIPEEMPMMSSGLSSDLDD